jgi:hypothetical protein
MSASFIMGTLPFGTLCTTMIKTNLFWVVPRKLTKSAPTLKVTLIHDSKQCPCHLQICRLNLTAVVGKLTAALGSDICLQRIVSVVGSTAIYFAVQKMFCYHLRQKARWCSVQKFFEKLLKLSSCTDYCNCGLMRLLTCC